MQLVELSDAGIIYSFPADGKEELSELKYFPSSSV